MSRRELRIAFACACALHVAVVLAVGHYRAPTWWENGKIAGQLLAGHGFSLDGREPTSLMAPGYPALLALGWGTVGPAATALGLSLLQALLVSAVVFPLAWLSERWLGPAAARGAVWLAVAWPLLAWYATRLHHTAIDMALYPWVVWAWVRLEPGGARRDVALAGLLTGVAGLFQPLILVAALLFGAWLAWRAPRRAAHVAALGLAVLVVLPWTARNVAVHHALVPIKNGFGKELWLGNNPHATGTAYALGGAEGVQDAHPPACAARIAGLPEKARFDAMQAEAWAYVRAEPGAFLARTAQKVLWLWTLTPADRVRSAHGGEALRYRWLHAASWLALVLLALAGAWRRRPLPADLGALLLGVALLYSLVYGLTHVGQARYRGEVELLVFPLAGAGLAWLLGWGSAAPEQEHVERDGAGAADPVGDAAEPGGQLG